jgi:hypothetical protein
MLLVEEVEVEVDLEVEVEVVEMLLIHFSLSPEMYHMDIA